MKNFYHYLAEAKKDYSYRIKMICDAVSEDTLDKIEYALRRYDVTEISTPRKTILHSSPIDFKDIPNAEVWIIDLKTSQPASSHYIMQEICNTLGLNQRFVVVRGSNDPLGMEVDKQEDLHDIHQQAAKQGLQPGSVLENPDYPEHSDPLSSVPAYGDEYNSKLLNYLAQVQANRPDLTAPEKDIKQGLFKFLGAKTAPAADFNDGIGGVKPVHSGTKKVGDEPEAMALVGRHGAFDPSAGAVNTTGLYKDKKGDTKVITSNRKGR